MKEIKFNAVDEDTVDYIVYNDWLNTDGYESGETPNEYLSAFLEFYYGYKLLQYTGLKDKNGKEIYSGDIVNIYGYGHMIMEFPFIGLYEARNENDIGEIVGNIYEHEHLLL